MWSMSAPAFSTKTKFLLYLGKCSKEKVAVREPHIATRAAKKHACSSSAVHGVT